MARPKAKAVPVRLEIAYERGGEADLKRALTVLAAMLRECSNGSPVQEQGNLLPRSIVYTGEPIR